MNEEENKERKKEEKNLIPSSFWESKIDKIYSEGELTPIEAIFNVYKKVKKSKEKPKELRFSDRIEKIKTENNDFGPAVFKCKYLNCPFFSFTKEELLAHYKIVHKENQKEKKKKQKIEI